LINKYKKHFEVLGFNMMMVFVQTVLCSSIFGFQRLVQLGLELRQI